MGLSSTQYIEGLPRVKFRFAAVLVFLRFYVKSSSKVGDRSCCAGMSNERFLLLLF
jgi:hypothetical protein